MKNVSEVLEVFGMNWAPTRRVREEFRKKTSPPFLAHGLSKVFDRSLYGASGGMCLKVFRKTSPPS